MHAGGQSDEAAAEQLERAANAQHSLSTDVPRTLRCHFTRESLCQSI